MIERGGEIPVLRSNGTTNTMLAAALAAMGIPFHTERPSTIAVGDGITGPGGRLTWYFQVQSECGKYNTAELIAAWENPEWHEKHPEHPFAYIKCAFQNYQRLIDKVKRDTPLGLTRKGRKLAIVSLGASQHFQDIIFRKL